MTSPLTVNVSLCNPGQVFACCGLLELADRLSSSDKPAMGCFKEVTTHETTFEIECPSEYKNEKITLNTICKVLKECSLSGGENKQGPLEMGFPRNLVLDWRAPFPQKRSVKAWALTGSTKFSELVRRLIENLPETFDGELLKVSKAMNKKATRFDPSHANKALDAGFSYNNLKGKKFSIFVTTELLALIGLQRFCPRHEKNENNEKRLVYCPWLQPLPVEIAALAISEPLYSLTQNSFAFQTYNAGTKDNPSKTFNVAGKLNSQRRTDK